MRENPVLSRGLVKYAGALIGVIRSTSKTTCYHFFCILIAISYLWVFARLQHGNGCETLEKSFSLHSSAVFVKIDQYSTNRLLELYDVSVPDRMDALGAWIKTGSGALI